MKLTIFEVWIKKLSVLHMSRLKKLLSAGYRKNVVLFCRRKPTWPRGCTAPVWPTRSLKWGWGAQMITAGQGKGRGQDWPVWPQKSCPESRNWIGLAANIFNRGLNHGRKAHELAQKIADWGLHKKPEIWWYGVAQDPAWLTDEWHRNWCLNGYDHWEQKYPFYPFLILKPHKRTLTLDSLSSFGGMATHVRFMFLQLPCSHQKAPSVDARVAQARKSKHELQLTVCFLLCGFRMTVLH